MAATSERAGSKPAKTPPVVQNRQPGKLTWAADFYRSGLGKKYAMAISGIVLMGYVFAHMVGNLKLYEGAEAVNNYGEWLRVIAYPALPNQGALWGMRLILLLAAVVHVHAAWSLTRMNRRARPDKYESKRDYVAADFAGRTMRWTGVIILLFVLFHLADLTFGTANPDFEYGDVYGNVVASFSQPVVAAIYVVANLALGLHLYHGVWSLFQTMGWNNRRFNHWRRYLAIGFAAVVVAGNVSFPIAVLTGVIS
jgi:succinate dehydrogenase / fumarate reductase, cytochrome b subunit